MDTRAIANEYRLKAWSNVIQNQKDSGLSIKVFCVKEGIHVNTYYYWQKKLRETICKKVMLPVNECLPVSGFAEVKVTSDPAPTKYNEHAKSKISIEVAGVHINTDSDYPVEKLAVLLRKVRQIC